MRPQKFHKMALSISVAVVLIIMVSGVAAARPDEKTFELYLQGDPIFFDAGCESVPLSMLVVDYTDSSRVAVSNACVTSEGALIEVKGLWKSLKIADTGRTRAEFETAWKSAHRPGARTEAESALIRAIKGSIESRGAEYDLVDVSIPTPKGARPGDQFPIEAEVILETGESVKVSAVMIAQSLTAPTGWVAGDAHTHSSDASDGQKTVVQIRDLALALGHKYLYLTDHVDLIAVKKGTWTNYCTLTSGASTSQLAVVPGLEVTARDANGDGQMDGDCLGFGLPVNDNSVLTQIPNQSLTCPEVVSRIHGFTNSVACPAHPNLSSYEWAVAGCGYRGSQVVAQGGTPFWTTSINNYIYVCRASAFGGSDFHGWFWESLGPVTWVHGENWSDSASWPTKVSKINQGMSRGRTCASLSGSYGTFTLNSQMPGSEFSVTTGSNMTGTVALGSINNGYSARATWRMYVNGSQIDSGVVTLPSGSVQTIGPRSVTARAGRNGYYMTVQMDYLNSYGAIVFTDMVYCGPITAIGQ